MGKIKKRLEKVRRRLGLDRSTSPTTHPINFVTGTLGAGKSYFATRMVREYLMRGKVVACNYDLVGDWWSTWVKNDVRYRMLSWEEKYRAGWDMRTRCYRFDRQDDLYNFALPGEGEDRGLLVMDEQALSRPGSDPCFTNSTRARSVTSVACTALTSALCEPGS